MHVVITKNNNCLHWAQKYMALVAVYMILANHIITNICCLDESCCLLKPHMSNSFLPCANEELTLLRWYLHYDTTNTFGLDVVVLLEQVDLANILPSIQSKPSLIQTLTTHNFMTTTCQRKVWAQRAEGREGYMNTLITHWY
jgi:hypothetical protein